MDTERIFSAFASKTVLIIGDVMIDAYMWGSVSRISPEAPVPVVAVNKREKRLGGAANVALNIQSLGARPVLCSVAGEDDAGKDLLSLLKKEVITSAGILLSKSRRTTVKTRILGGNHQMMRVDEEQEDPLSASDEKKLIALIRKLIVKEKADVIIFEDYDKGTITPAIIREVVKFANERKIPTVVDPKKRNFNEYRDVTLFKPNLKEMREGLKTELDASAIGTISNAASRFMRKQGIRSILLTLSEKGIFMQTGKERHLIPAHVRDITDVSGAGDTVVAVAALALAGGLPSRHIAALANLAGGLVCEKAGVVPVDKNQLLREAANEEIFSR